MAYANPEEGRNSWVGYYGIRKGTENLDNAYAFLDGKLADETARQRSQAVLLRHRQPGSDERASPIPS